MTEENKIRLIRLGCFLIDPVGCGIAAVIDDILPEGWAFRVACKLMEKCEVNLND